MYRRSARSMGAAGAALAVLIASVGMAAPGLASVQVEDVAVINEEAAAVAEIDDVAAADGLDESQGAQDVSLESPNAGADVAREDDGSGVVVDSDETPAAASQDGAIGGNAGSGLDAEELDEGVSSQPVILSETFSGKGDDENVALAAVTPFATDETCIPDPYDGAEIFLRGGFNGWGTSSEYRFVYDCNRFVATFEARGGQEFKIADGGWSVANFGRASGREDQPQMGEPYQLAHDGGNLWVDFSGLHRAILDVSVSSTSPTLLLDTCAAEPLPNGVLLDIVDNPAISIDAPFLFDCDAYYMNATATGSQSFLIGDPNSGDDYTYGIAAGATVESGVAVELVKQVAGGQDINFDFTGDHTLTIEFDEDGTPILTIGARSWVNPGIAVPVFDEIAQSIVFDSRDETYKAPYGALVEGSEVDFSLSAKQGVDAVTLVVETRHLEGNGDVLEYTEVGRVNLSAGDVVDGEQVWSGSYTFGSKAVYGYYFEVQIGDRSFVYANNDQKVYQTVERGTFGEGKVEYKPANAVDIRRYRQTIYDANYQVPDWAADAVYYYIFPERFRNGDPSNDPKKGVDFYLDGDVEVHDDWLEPPVTGEETDGVWNNDFFGGDLAGIIEKLDYMQNLGVNTLYMTPIFEAGSNHKYDTGDYMNIDDNFGTNEDFTKLTELAKEKGIRVIVDASFNHTGADSVYFDQYGRYPDSLGAYENGAIQEDSPWAAFYDFRADGTYAMWAEMPELSENRAWLDFAFGNDDSVTDTWLNRGASGWRMDVAPWVSDDFWKEWRTAVKQNDPDALTIAETWFDSSKYFLGDTFDSTMNYIFRDAVMDFANGENAAEAYQNIELMREAYPEQSFYALMNLLSTHDETRALDFYGYTDDSNSPEVIAAAKQRLRLSVLFQMAFPGSPAIYYGDEVGVTGGSDPQNRRTYPWADLGGSPDEELLADFQELVALRNNNDVLRRGSIDAPVYLDENVIVLVREHAGTVALTAFNNSDTEQEVTVELPSDIRGLDFLDALDGGTVSASGETITVTVPAVYGTVLMTEVEVGGETPGTETPGTETPGVDTPDGETPDGEQPDGQAPDAGQPDGSGSDEESSSGSQDEESDVTASDSARPEGNLSDTGAQVLWLVVLALGFMGAGGFIWWRVRPLR